MKTKLVFGVLVVAVVTIAAFLNGYVSKYNNDERVDAYLGYYDGVSNQSLSESEFQQLRDREAELKDYLSSGDFHNKEMTRVASSKAVIWVCCFSILALIGVLHSGVPFFTVALTIFAAIAVASIFAHPFEATLLVLGAPFGVVCRQVWCSLKRGSSEARTHK